MFELDTCRNGSPSPSSNISIGVSDFICPSPLWALDVASVILCLATTASSLVQVDMKWSMSPSANIDPHSGHLVFVFLITVFPVSLPKGKGRFLVDVVENVLMRPDGVPFDDPTASWTITFSVCADAAWRTFDKVTPHIMFWMHRDGTRAALRSVAIRSAAC